MGVEVDVPGYDELPGHVHHPGFGRHGTEPRAPTPVIRPSVTTTSASGTISSPRMVTTVAPAQHHGSRGRPPGEA